MTMIKCRQCGHSAQHEDFPTGAFRCASCDWREIISPPKSRGRKKPQGDAEAVQIKLVEEAAEEAGLTEEIVDLPDDAMPTDTLESEEDAMPHDENSPATPVECCLPSFSERGADEFVEWCASLFQCFGFAVTVHAAGEADCDLELSRDGRVTYVDCAPTPTAERAACQRLVGAMIGGGVNYGMIVAAGSFGEGCREYVDRIDQVRINLMDGEDLARTVEEMLTGPLSRWWDGSHLADSVTLQDEAAPLRKAG